MEVQLKYPIGEQDFKSLREAVQRILQRTHYIIVAKL